MFAMVGVVFGAFCSQAWAEATSSVPERPREIRLAALTHEVRPGETASGIARSYGVATGDLIRENDIADPHLLFAGRELRIPGAAPRPSRHRTVVIQPGETLWRIATRHGVDVAVLASLNRIPDPGRVVAGRRLRIPESRAVPDVDLIAIDALLASSNAALRSADFERATTLTERARVLAMGTPGARPADGVDRSASRRARQSRVEVLSATLAVAYGRHAEAVDCLRRALGSDPQLELDPRTTSPKLVRALASARGVGPDPGSLPAVGAR